jgi:hypothetical protein
VLVWRDGCSTSSYCRQKVTSVSVSFDVRPGDVPPGWRVVGSMHSHGAFRAYASTTDEDDEAELDGLHVVVGDLGGRSIGYAAAVVVDGVRFDLKPSRPSSGRDGSSSRPTTGWPGSLWRPRRGDPSASPRRSSGSIEGSDPRTRSRDRAWASSMPLLPRRAESPPPSGTSTWPSASRDRGAGSGCGRASSREAQVQQTAGEAPGGAPRPNHVAGSRAVPLGSA